MGIIGSMFRWVSTLGGLIGSSIDESTDGMVTTPAGIKATFRQAREEWTRQYQDVRDAVIQLVVVAENKASEIERLSQEQDELALKMDGAIEKFKETADDKYKAAFSRAHARSEEIGTRVEQLKTEKAEVDHQVDGYKVRLKDMQDRIKELDAKEAESLADIVSSQQIVQLNDRLGSLSTGLQDQNLAVIEKKRAQLKAKARLSSELSDHEDVLTEREIVEAGTRSKSDDAFEAMLQASKQKDADPPDETPAHEGERQL